jgi:hypothetical protein
MKCMAINFGQHCSFTLDQGFKQFLDQEHLRTRKYIPTRTRVGVGSDHKSGGGGVVCSKQAPSPTSPDVGQIYLKYRMITMLVQRCRFWARGHSVQEDAQSHFVRPKSESLCQLHVSYGQF